MAGYPEWLHFLAGASLLLGIGCFSWLAFDEIRHPQKMGVMNVVWPITGLYLGPFAIALYRKSLPLMVQHGDAAAARRLVQTKPRNSPDWLQTSVAVSHCGAGCTLGDMVGEVSAAALSLAFAGQFGSKLVVDFLLAYGFGIVFQYFSIVPMRGLSVKAGLKAAVRADTISITLFEIGMFGWMALTYFVFFPAPHLRVSEAVFWFMMQLAMIAGSLTSYPANQWLIRNGWKEKMPEYRTFEAKPVAKRAA